MRVVIDVLRHGLSERESLRLESVAIDLLPSLANRVAGHESGRMSVTELDAHYARPVEIDAAHRVVLIRLNNSFGRSVGDAEQLYDATRRWWRVGDRARDLGSARAPEWAMAVYQGVVRAVYRIEGWEQPPQAQIGGDPKHEGRWGFFGTPDPSMEALYLHRDVSSYLRSLDGAPSQN